jgi:hypothetical protein
MAFEHISTPTGTFRSRSPTSTLRSLHLSDWDNSLQKFRCVASSDRVYHHLAIYLLADQTSDLGRRPRALNAVAHAKHAHNCEYDSFSVHPRY